MVRDIAPESMQFGSAFPRILQEIWEADLVKRPIQVYKLYVLDAYHCGTLRPAQVGAFAYVVTSVAVDDCVIICIYFVLPMVWVDSPKYFCAIQKRLQTW